MKKTVKIRKGDFGYIRHQRKVTILRTIIMLGISLGVFAVGYFYNGRDIKNVLTIVAVLGLLPASKSLVNAIMFIKAKGCSSETQTKILENGPNFHHYYDFYFTAYEKNYPVSHMILLNQALIGVTEWDKCDTKEGEKHLKNHLKQDGLKEIAVKIYKDADEYCERLAALHYEYDPLSDTDNNPEREEKVFAVLKAISL